MPNLGCQAGGQRFEARRFSQAGGSNSRGSGISAGRLLAHFRLCLRRVLSCQRERRSGEHLRAAECPAYGTAQRQPGERAGGRAAISDFSEVLEEIALQSSGSEESSAARRTLAESELCGKRIPLTAIPFDQIAVIYPVAHIGALLQRAERKDHAMPRFLDFDQSELIRLLRTKLW